MIDHSEISRKHQGTAGTETHTQGREKSRWSQLSTAQKVWHGAIYVATLTFGYYMAAYAAESQPEEVGTREKVTYGGWTGGWINTIGSWGQRSLTTGGIMLGSSDIKNYIAGFAGGAVGSWMESTTKDPVFGSMAGGAAQSVTAALLDGENLTSTLIQGQTMLNMITNTVVNATAGLSWFEPASLEINEEKSQSRGQKNDETEDESSTDGDLDDATPEPQGNQPEYGGSSREKSFGVSTAIDLGSEPVLRN
ncbi:hypothetical protein TWF718_005082 [Orbilia javanica]|uniref:Uncharacterized protein n=1 Tax=Orbilia javanica TaxID=47235 RepID=A0AAN8N3P8_9PEZI